MNATVTKRITIHLSEWDKFSPKDFQYLTGRTDLADEDRDVCTKLSEKGYVKIQEFKSGVDIRTTSYVGCVSFSGIELRIEPKIRQLPLLSLFRYGYRLNTACIYGQQQLNVSDLGIQDILILQLVTEVEFLLKRGLLRRYVERRKCVSYPRGRIDIGAISRKGGITGEQLPCVVHPRSIDIDHNRMLVAGLTFAARITKNEQLRFRCKRFSHMIADGVSQCKLTTYALDQVETLGNRLTSHYRPSLRLIRMLKDSQGSSLDGYKSDLRVPGFLFDMNRLFQSVLTRFLAENLETEEVIPEHSIKGMLQFAPGFNPTSRKPPTPRPDLLLRRDGQIVSVLDVKYRDLWQNTLPRDMLYQLAIYALAHNTLSKATILYPSLETGSQEARIQICDPMTRIMLGSVQLRPVLVSRLIELIELKNSSSAQRERRQFAEIMAFGVGTKTKIPIAI